MSEDIIREEIPRAEAPALRLIGSFGVCLYHRLMERVRRFSLTGQIDAGGAWPEAIRRVSKLYIPLGPFNWLEYALSEAESVDELQGALSARAALLAHELGQALAAVADGYRDEEWPGQRELLRARMTELAAQLRVHKDRLLCDLARHLAMPAQPDAIAVHLVGVCHEPLGGYSHPIVIDVSRFQGLALVEAVLHEYAHVLADRNRHDPASGLAALRALCKEAGKSERFALELLHLVTFYLTGQLVCAVCDPGYQPHGRRKGVYALAGAKLGGALDEAQLDEAWLLSGGEERVDMRALGARLLEALGRGARR